MSTLSVVPEPLTVVPACRPRRKAERNFSERKSARIGDQAIALSGLVGFGLAWLLLPALDLPSAGTRMLAVSFFTVVPMVLLSVFGAQTHLRQTSGLSPVSRPADLRRVGTKFLGLLATLAVLALAYWVFPEYQKEKYAPVWEAVTVAGLPLMLAAWFYMLWVDERMTDPFDGYWMAGRLVLGKWGDLNGACLRGYSLSWAVKGFFFPFMIAALASHSSGLLEKDWTLARFDQLYLSGLSLIYCVDTLFGALGYVLTLRILDSQIRSVQPDVFGWVVALVCYSPFSAALSTFQNYRSDDVDWSTIFRGHPVVFITWGFVILCCLFVYVWSTVSFGCRFSNLTNRGIIRSGPYRWMKHPAYVSKNFAWWLMYVPFCASASWQDNLRASLMLASVNLIYFLRARTEEKHLGTDPAYRIYSRWMERFGFWASLRTLFRGTRRNSWQTRKPTEMPAS